jgi:hypothetical protein
MYISPKYKFIFLRTPKTASSSLMEFFVKNIPDPHAIYGPIEDTENPGTVSQQVLNKYKADYKIYHLTIKDLLDSEIITEHQLNTYYNFAVLRDPIDRQKSFYYFFRKWRSAKGAGSLEEYKSYVNEKGWFKNEPNSAIKQTDFLTLYSELRGEYWLYEQLNDRLVEFMNKLNIDITHPLQDFKSTFRNDRTSEFRFDRGAVTTMADYFREDFNLYSKIKVDEYDGKYAQSVEGFYTSN